MSRYTIVIYGQSDRKPCAECGKEFARDKRCTWSYWERARFCSSACAGTANARARRLPIELAFRKKHELGTGCWHWTGAKDKDGYGLFTRDGKQHRAPVMALQLDGRPVTPGHYACHHCDNPSCVRPSHLYVGTPKQNYADAVSRKRVRPSGAKLKPEQVIAIRAAQGTHEAIAARFGVSRANVSLIKERKTWRGLP